MTLPFPPLDLLKAYLYSHQMFSENLLGQDIHKKNQSTHLKHKHAHVRDLPIVDPLVGFARNRHPNWPATLLGKRMIILDRFAN